MNSKSKTEETCLEEYISFIKCRDKCVSINSGSIMARKNDFQLVG